MAVRSLGLFVASTGASSPEFISASNLSDVVILEHISLTGVTDYLCALLKQRPDGGEDCGRKLIPLLLGTLPRPDLLRLVFCDIQDVLFADHDKL